MSKSKKNKINKLTDEEYRAYILSLKEDAALYAPDGDYTLPKKEAEQKGEPKK